MTARFAPLPLPPLRDPAYAPPPGLPRVLHADARLVAFDKPSGLLAVPGRTAELADCLAARAEAAFPGARIVHRLDRDTSGVILLARDADAQRHLGLQFERRGVAKTYLARVAGLPADDTGEIDLPLRADWPNRPRQTPHPEGRPALTRWQVLARAPRAAPRGAARLRLSPVTGRSHQLRVHLLALGHPILGDALYADADAYAAAPRLQLHAETLELRHPDDGRPLRLTAPPPF
jgi:tRNA pseudouridine32 synthase/23S rRNA pseudouridine746 synthase